MNSPRRTGSTRLPRVMISLIAMTVAAAVLALSGCGQQKLDSVTRTGNRELGGQDDRQTSKALTWIPVADRKKAPVASGPALTGKGTVSTANYPGKVVVINVWGSWCAPCRLEAQDLAEVSRKTAKTAAFVGINIRDSDPAPARAFVRAFDVPYPHIYDPNGEQLVRFAGTLPPNGIPTTLIIDRNGLIAARVVGIVDKKTLLGLIDDAHQGK